jgi:phosphoribosyl 1,2-cyclic phosphate phosphodiesterase
MFKVTVLGCGASAGVPILKYGWGVCDPKNPKNRRLRSSIMIETEKTSLLIDMSPDLREQLLNLGSSKVDGVLLTHEHYDHVNGINELRPVFFEMNRSLEIYGYKNVIENVRKMFYYLFEESGSDIYKPYISTNIVTEDFSIGDISGICFEQNHGYSTTMGIRIGNFAYSTDVVEFNYESFEKLRGLDIWIVGCLTYKKKLTHANLEQVLEWVQELRPKTTFLTHMSLEMDYDSLLLKLPDNVRPAYDGIQIIL